MHLAFEPDLPNGPFGASAMLVTRSTDGGQTWGKPITLIKDPAGQGLNDKNSLTADPKNPDLAYAVWDRLPDFTCRPRASGQPAGSMPATHAGDRHGRRRRSRGLEAGSLKTQSDGGEQAPPQVFFEGPTYFSRTTDAGKTWETARKIYDPGPNEQTIANQIVVRPDGTLVDFFTHFLPTGATRLELIRSHRQGQDLEQAHASPRSMAPSARSRRTSRSRSATGRSSSTSRSTRRTATSTPFAGLRFHGVDEVAF